MFRRMFCLIKGHRDRHVRNLSHPEFSLLRESVWRCSACGRETTLGGWQEPPVTVPLPPVETLAIGSDVQQMDHDAPPNDVITG